MLKNKQFFIPSLALSAYIFISVFAASPISASDLGIRTKVIERLSKRLDLTEEEVQSFFEEKHAERTAEKAALMEERLDEAVTHGLISKEQKENAMALFADFSTLKEEFTKEEQKEIRIEHQEALHTWAEEADINLKLFIENGVISKKSKTAHTH